MTSQWIEDLLSTKMALLCPSIDIPHVGTQKNNLDRSGQNTIDGHDLRYIILLLAWPIFYKVIRVNSQLLPLQPMYHSQILTLQPMYTSLGLEFVGFPYASRVSYVTY